MIATATGFSHRYLIADRASAPKALRFPLDLTELEATVEGTSDALTLRTSDGDILFQGDAARMWGASIDPLGDEPTVEHTLDARVSRQGPLPTLVVPLPTEFLDDPRISYPVTIDPTAELVVAKDTYVRSDNPSDVFTNDPDLKVGSWNGGTSKYRSFVRFHLGAVGGIVQAAELRLWENWSASCSSTPFDVYRLNEGFSSPSWSSQPAVGAIYSSTSAAKGFSGSCPAGWVSATGGGTSGRTMTQLVQGWADESIPNYGVSLRAASETQTQQWKKFDSSTASHPPMLVVTYNHEPLQPSSVLPVEDSTLRGGTDQVVSATFEDPDDGDSGAALFRVFNTSGVLVDSSGAPTGANVSAIGSSTPSGQSVGVSSATLALPTGSYTIRAQSDDGEFQSAWTSPHTFHVNTAQPPTAEAYSVPDDSETSFSMAFSQPLAGSFVAGHLSSVTTGEVVVSRGTDEGTQGYIELDGSVSTAISEFSSLYGAGPLTRVRFDGIDSASTTVPAALMAYVDEQELTDAAAEPADEFSVAGAEPELDTNGQPREVSASKLWVPHRGRVRTYSDGNGHGVFAMTFDATAGDRFEGGTAYEHDFKLVRNVCSTPYWVHRRGSGWNTNMPDGYIDHATQGDPCTVLDLTVGSYHPEKFNTRQYQVAIVANRNTDNHTGSRYQLRAEQLDRDCDFSPWCVGEGGFASRMLLIAESKGFAPGCRDWWRDRPSEAC